MAVEYVGAVGIAEALGVSRHAVHKWRTRFPISSSHPFPEPDIEVDGTPGWRASRLTEVKQWREGLPGRGTGGGRPTAARQEYLAMAITRGFDREEALRALASLAEEFPEMTEPQICGWLMDHWRG
jgi:hypothetical protein